MIENFYYDAAVVERYPAIRAGVILARGLHCGAGSSQIVDILNREQQQVLERVGETPLSELPSIAAWRRVFSDFGVKPTKYRNAAEALLRRLVKQGHLPSINPLVDIANLVSIRYALPVAVFDAAHLRNSVAVRFADGTETFSDLGEDRDTHPDPGEVIFADEDATVIARRWCWRQSAPSAARQDTEDALITVEGHHDKAEEDCRTALADLQELLGRFAGGTLRSARLSAESPDFFRATGNSA